MKEGERMRGRYDDKWIYYSVFQKIAAPSSSMKHSIGAMYNFRNLIVIKINVIKRKRGRYIFYSSYCKI